MPHRDPLKVLANRRVIPLVLLTHPFELALGGVLVINGVRGFFGDVSTSLAALPHWLVIVFLVVSTVGGAGVTVGLILRSDHLVGLGVRLERSSLFLVAASYFTLAVAILQTNGKGGIGVAATLIFVMAGCLLRARAIYMASKTILHTLMIVNRESEL
jgi:hypothetical protein